MHDPMTVAFSIPSPIPRRKRWRDAKDGKTCIKVRRRTNEENLGERVYPWWRLRGYELWVRGRSIGLNEAVCVWHVEPGDRDSGEVCKHRHKVADIHPLLRRTPLVTKTRWKDQNGDEWAYTRFWLWHVRHWRVQIRLLGKLQRFLLERCEGCGRRYPWGYAPISHQWDSPRTRWRDGVVRRSFHHECSSLEHYRANYYETLFTFEHYGPRHDELVKAGVDWTVAWRVTDRLKNWREIPDAKKWLERRDESGRIVR